MISTGVTLRSVPSQGDEMKPSTADCSLASGSSSKQQTEGFLSQSSSSKQQCEGFLSQSSSTKWSPVSPHLPPGPGGGEQGAEPASPPKTPSTVSLTESLQSATQCKGAPLRLSVMYIY